MTTFNISIYRPIVFISTLSIFLTGCGQYKKIFNNRIRDSIGGHTQQLWTCTMPTELRQAVERAKKEAARAQEVEHKANELGLEGQMRAIIQVQATPLKPYIANKDLLTEKTEKLIKTREELNFDGTPYEWGGAVKSYVGKAYGLKEMAIRFESAYCRQKALNENANVLLKRDVRSGFVMENLGKQLCPSHDENCLEENLGADGDPTFISAVKETCQKLGIVNGKECPLSDQNEGQRAKIYQDLLENFSQNILRPYFTLKSIGERFKCTKSKDNGEHVTMEVPINEQDKQLQDWIRESYKKYWDTEKFKILPVFVESGRALSIHKTDVGISHVRDNGLLVIHLAHSVFNYKRKFKSVFAHEFGHVLGLPDCYVEFFNAGEHVYYEINQENLMCSSADYSHISKEAIQQIVEQRCL